MDGAVTHCYIAKVTQDGKEVDIQHFCGDPKCPGPS